MIAATKRKLISDDAIVVVFDTSPIRNLAHSSEPEWVSIFSRMREDGYSFSLSDAATVELLVQVRSGRIPLDGYERMIGLCKTFLNEQLPMIPGKIDLEAIIGINNDPEFIEETKYLSHHAWTQLQNPSSAYPHDGPPLEELLDEEREEWGSFLYRIAGISLSYGIDIWESDPETAHELLATLLGKHSFIKAEIEPSMSVRMHLETRYRLRQMFRSAKLIEPYTPSSKKNRNDGIDVDMFRYLILPAFVIAEDSGFFGSLQGIESFQREWFIRPEDLARRWINGERPSPEWPVET
jgi:hypothetical protein